MTGAAPLLVDIEPIHYSIAPDELRRGLEDPSPGLPPSGRW